MSTQIAPIQKPTPWAPLKPRDGPRESSRIDLKEGARYLKQFKRTWVGCGWIVGGDVWCGDSFEVDSWNMMNMWGHQGVFRRYLWSWGKISNIPIPSNTQTQFQNISHIILPLSLRWLVGQPKVLASLDVFGLFQGFMLHKIINGKNFGGCIRWGPPRALSLPNVALQLHLWPNGQNLHSHGNAAQWYWSHSRFPSKVLQRFSSWWPDFLVGLAAAGPRNV